MDPKKKFRFTIIFKSYFRKVFILSDFQSVILLIFLSSSKIYAQKEYNIWYFGDHAGINFNTSPPTPLLNSQLYSWEASSGICDANGNLLFYTNGDTIMNRLHKPMKNGILLPNYFVMSAVQGVIVAPVPGSCSKYFIFCTESIETRSTNGHLRYSVIDMNGDGGLGEVTVSQRRLIPKPDESMALTLHANGLDYWVATINRISGEYNAIRTSDGNIDSTLYKQSIYQTSVNITTMKFSPDSKKMYVYGFTNGFIDTFFLYLYQFDNSSGKLKNQLKIPGFDDFFWSWIAEFSPDSRFLYAIQRYAMGGQPIKIIQLDLSVWDRDSIINSAQTISLSSRHTTGLQLAPDGKIYLFHRNLDKLSVIHEPNIKTPGCNLEIDGFDLGGRKSITYSPYFPSCKIKNISGLFQPNLGNDTVLCEGNSMPLSVKQYDTFCNKKIRWNTGESTKSIQVYKAGLYWVKIFNGKDSLSDTISIAFSKKFKLYLGPDTGFCGKFKHLLNANAKSKKYLWNTGDTTVSILIDKPDWYSVVIKDSLNCQAGDTILVQQLLAPLIQLYYDSISCKYVFLSSKPQDEVNYLWNNGDTGSLIKVDKKGLYTLKAYNKFCSISSEIIVDQLPITAFKLGNDTIVCTKDLTLNSIFGQRCIWSTGDTTNSIKVDSNGTYWVTSFSRGCKVSDTMNIIFDCNVLTYFIPSCFTPNFDNLNDLFQIQGTNIENISMSIYNRWGEKLFENSGKQVSWDGTYQSEACQQDVYIYVIKINGSNNFKPFKKTLTGNITLVR